MREREGTAVIIAVDPGNLASIKGIERAGFQPLYRYIRLRRYGRPSESTGPFELRFAGRP